MIFEDALKAIVSGKADGIKLRKKKLVFTEIYEKKRQILVHANTEKLEPFLPSLEDLNSTSWELSHDAKEK